MAVDVSAQDKDKLQIVLSLVDSVSRAGLNASNEIARDVKILKLKALGYEIAGDMARVLPV